MSDPNTVQQLVVDATSGYYNLTYAYPITPTLTVSSVSAASMAGTVSLGRAPTTTR